MTIDLYSTSSDERRAVKDLTLIAENVPIKPTDTIDMLQPNFIISYNAAYLGANYLYCPDFSRYYFVGDLQVEIGKRIIFPCKVDALSSWITQLRSCPCTVTRSEMVGITAVPDAQLPVDPNRREYKVMDFDAESPYPFDISATAPYLLEVL